MATLFIEEHSKLKEDANGKSAPVPDAVISKQQVTIDTASGVSSAVDSQTTFVCLTGDADCYYEVGASPVAAAGSSSFLPSGTVKYVSVVGGSDKIATIEKV
ncbi:MAG: hypothetical protein GWN62_06880 [Aliifodinibius sp.]|nr:hypothetical protein [Fodinibius sp.]